MVVTGLSLTADFIDVDTESSAFVYGIMSFTDKLSSGLGVFFIQHLTPENDSEGKTFYIDTLFYACGGACVLSIIGILTLIPFKIGQRRHRAFYQVYNNNEQIPLLLRK